MAIDTLGIVCANDVHIAVIIYPQFANDNIVNGSGDLADLKIEILSFRSVRQNRTNLSPSVTISTFLKFHIRNA